jgi:EAL domain-containing protein (putative c-di-GMP-specific phosphodiesterase class I)
VLGYFKLLHLRDVNERCGYAQGDELIADTARLLRRAFSARHLCYVSSGEFCVLCYREEAERGAALVREGLDSYKLGLQLQSKMGFAPWQEGERAISVVDKAKLALNSILKSAERDVRFYDSALDEELRFQRYILSHVDEAIEKGWLKVYYQPIARAVTGHVCNEEALSRWDDPEYGFLMPYRFIPVLEENGLMYKVNLNVVSQVLRHFRRKQELGVPIVPVSVNLSRRDFERCDMVGQIVRMTDEAGYPHSMLKIEITESALISSQEMLRREVERFHENGFEVWLDDFGSEYSTLNLLQDLDVDLIKLDMRFMRNFKSGGKNHIIVAKVLEMAKQLGVDTLIEGVETIEHFNIMQKLGCDKIQGYLFNRPNSIDYIINRALGGTGLRFETPEAAPYYEAIGRVDFSEPLRSAETGGVRVESELATGVIELRGGEFACLRGNDSFQNRLQAQGLLSGETQGLWVSMPLRPVPEELSEAAGRCRSTAEWVSFALRGPTGESLTVYLRLLTEYEYNGGKAMLTVLLPG